MKDIVMNKKIKPARDLYCQSKKPQFYFSEDFLIGKPIGFVKSHNLKADFSKSVGGKCSCSDISYSDDSAFPISGGVNEIVNTVRLIMQTIYYRFHLFAMDLNVKRG